MGFSRANLNWKDYVVVDEIFYRPAEVNVLLGDHNKAKRMLG